MWFPFRPYVSVAQRRAKAQKKLQAMSKKGYAASPVVIQGRKIATTFWGQAWCDNLEAYSDFANRLPRGRTYARNGSVIDLQIAAGQVKAMVSGSELYNVTIDFKSLAKAFWTEIKTRCAGQIGSLVDLLQGKLSPDVMSVVTCREKGLFPKPSEIGMKCTCPDWATMCKHVAAVLYGVGARLDRQPELLFKLRQVDHLELITAAGDAAVGHGSSRGKKTIAASELGDVFGIELTDSIAAEPATPKKLSRKTNRAKTVAPGKRATKQPRARAIGRAKKAAVATAAAPAAPVVRTKRASKATAATVSRRKTAK